MAEITSEDELEDWLRDKPADWAQVIAARAALRILPTIFHKQKIIALKYEIIATFRSVIISWIAGQNIYDDMSDPAFFAVDSNNDLIPDAMDFSLLSISANAYSSGPDSHELAIAAVKSAVLVSNLPSNKRYSAISDALSSGRNAALIWQSIESDANFLEHSNSKPASISLTSKPLWFANQIPSDILSLWKDTKYQLEKIDCNYIHWIDWYERRIRGEKASFDIFHDVDRREDKEILKKLADATDENFWGKGAEYVNQQLSDWLREARERAQERYEAENAAKAHKPTTDEEIKSSLSSTASPQIQVEDGKLTAAPNQIFDKPQYSDDLANLPMVLRTFIDTLVNSLPTQAAPIVRNSLAAYQEELLVRGTQPILPIVKGFASSIAAQVLDNAHDLENTPPDQWTLKDEREWDDGTADLFRTFFKYHLDLINHFPMDEEREEILSNLPIDEEKASGKALIEPIERVNEIVLAMVDKGYASHDIGKIIKAHSQYNRDIAGLLPPSEDIDPKSVTPKRRHVLNTQGLYLNIYNTILATASFANSITPAQIDWILQSIQTLMGFIIR